MRPGSARALHSPQISCGPPRPITAPPGSGPRRPATGLSRPWPTPPESCTARLPPWPRPESAWGRSPGTPWRTTCSNTPAGNAGLCAYPPAPGTPSSTTYAMLLTPPASPTAPRTGCWTATPFRCSGAPPTPATRTPPGNWPVSWPGARTWINCVPGLTPGAGPSTQPVLVAALAQQPGQLPGGIAVADVGPGPQDLLGPVQVPDRKSTRLNSSHANISYAVFCLKKK